VTDVPDFDPAGHAARHWAYTVLADLPGCGCGWPDELHALWRSTLTTIRDLRDDPDPAAMVKALRQAMPDHLHRYLVLACLDRVRLLDHGTDIDWSWLTVKGARFLEILELASGPDDLDVGYSCSNCPDWPAAASDGTCPSVEAVGAFPHPDMPWPGYRPPWPLAEAVDAALKAIGRTAP
jgi:hypothetical protein